MTDGKKPETPRTCLVCGVLVLARQMGSHRYQHVRKGELSAADRALYIRMKNCFNHMKSRCNDESHVSYEYYVARGVRVCHHWMVDDGFANFIADMGMAPEGMTLDRINTTGNYSPENCRWSTVRDQFRNMRRNRFITFQGRTLVIADWAKEVGLHGSTIQSRLALGWSVERALTTPRRINGQG